MKRLPSIEELTKIRDLLRLIDQFWEKLPDADAARAEWENRPMIKEVKSLIKAKESEFPQQS